MSSTLEDAKASLMFNDNFGVLACDRLSSLRDKHCWSFLDNHQCCMSELTDVVSTNLMGMMGDDGVCMTVLDPRLSLVTSVLLCPSSSQELASLPNLAAVP